MSRYTQTERIWDIFFYISTHPPSVSFDAIYQLFEGKFIKKTLKRDLLCLSRYGIEKIDNQVVRYKYTGATGPFTQRRGEKYCISCEEFKPKIDFGLNSSTKDGFANYCLACKNPNARRLYWKNQEFILRKIRKTYHLNHPEASYIPQRGIRYKKTSILP